jgi:hypothetical protein
MNTGQSNKAWFTNLLHFNIIQCWLLSLTVSKQKEHDVGVALNGTAFKQKLLKNGQMVQN